MTANNQPSFQHEESRQPIFASSRPILSTLGDGERGGEKDGEGENDRENEKRVLGGLSKERVERWRSRASSNEEQRVSEEIVRRRRGEGVKQRNRQEHQFNQLQNKLAEERRQTENLVKQQVELHTRQDQLQHQVENERTGCKYETERGVHEAQAEC